MYLSCESPIGGNLENYQYNRVENLACSMALVSFMSSSLFHICRDQMILVPIFMANIYVSKSAVSGKSTFQIEIAVWV